MYKTILFKGILLLLLNTFYTSSLFAQNQLSDSTSKAIIDTTKIVEDENVYSQFLRETGNKIKISGFVKLNFFYDFFGMRNSEGFQPYTIPTDPNLNKSFRGLYIGARDSRISIKSEVKTKYSPLETRIEGDFMGQQGQSILRLRHAVATLGYWSVGHTWTTFSDITSVPFTIDNEGPNSNVWVRQGLIRFKRKINDDLDYAISVEHPTTGYTNPFDSTSNGELRQKTFDLASRIKHTWFNGHLQIAAVFRELTYKDQYQQDQDNWGYGVLVSGTYTPSLLNRIFFQAIYGKGIANYVTGLRGNGLDAVPNYDTGKLDLLPVYGGFIALEHDWSQGVFSTITIGGNRIENTEHQASSAYKNSIYASANIFWNPLSNIDIGGGFVWGKRVDKDDTQGNALRFQAISVINF